jgi:uncharacterized protein (TIGR03545 family)
MTEIKKVKKKGPIRFEAIIPVLILTGLTFAYFTIYFDRHLKGLVEYVGTQANGAEVNVDSINTSFIRGSFDLNRLQVTDKDRPTHNSLEIGNMHFSYLWDALLRMKFVVQEASITNIQISKPRKTPGKVLPPEPAKPSKLTEIQNQVLNQVKNKYSSNMLGDTLALLEGGDYRDQLEKIRDTLKSEARIKQMTSEVESKKDFWDKKIKELGDTSRLKQIESEVQVISREKDLLKQAQGAQKLADLLKEVDKQYKEIQSASKQLQSEVKAVAQYPKEIQSLVDQDIAALKNRFSIPEIDFKDMAMHLFAGQFVEYIAKARKYQELAKQYIPEKKDQEKIIPPKRSEGKTYQFPITNSYPLFWLKKAAISSTGTADSFSGNVSGELTNVTTDPKFVKIPLILDIKGDFPAAEILGVRSLVTIDHTKTIARQSLLLQVNSFQVPEKLFVDDSKLKFGFLNAIGSTTFNASLTEGKIEIDWSSALTKPQFLVETSNKIAKEMLASVLNGIPLINIKGKARGSFRDLDLDISSNLGDELGNGFKREIGAKVAEAQNKISAMVEEKINRPKEALLSALNGNSQNLTQLGKLEELYKQNENKIQAEIEKLRKGGSTNLKDQGKKLLKGFKI